MNPYWLPDKNNNPEGKGDESNHTTQGESNHTHAHRIHRHSFFLVFYTYMHNHRPGYMTTMETLGIGWFFISVAAVDHYHSSASPGHSACPFLFANAPR